MNRFSFLPTYEQVSERPKGKKEKMVALMANAMLFPVNKNPIWETVDGTRRGMNLRLQGIHPKEDVRLVQLVLRDAGWEISDIKYHAGNTLVQLIVA